VSDGCQRHVGAARGLRCPHRPGARRVQVPTPRRGPRRVHG